MASRELIAWLRSVLQWMQTDIALHDREAERSAEAAARLRSRIDMLSAEIAKAEEEQH